MQVKGLSPCLAHRKGSANSVTTDRSNSSVEVTRAGVRGVQPMQSHRPALPLAQCLAVTVLKFLAPFPTRDRMSSFCSELQNLKRWS